MSSFSNPGRKLRKVLVERRRRERIDRCLEQLRSIIQSETENINYTSQTGSHVASSAGGGSVASKLEKADILEMTVEYLYALNRQRAAQTAHGFISCLREVGTFLQNEERSGVKAQVTARLISQLSRRARQVSATCGTDINTFAPSALNASIPSDFLMCREEGLSHCASYPSHGLLSGGVESVNMRCASSDNSNLEQVKLMQDRTVVANNYYWNGSYYAAPILSGELPGSSTQAVSYSHKGKATHGSTRNTLRAPHSVPIKRQSRQHDEENQHPNVASRHAHGSAQRQHAQCLTRPQSSSQSSKHTHRRFRSLKNSGRSNTIPLGDITGHLANANKLYNASNTNQVSSSVSSCEQLSAICQNTERDTLDLLSPRLHDLHSTLSDSVNNTTYSELYQCFGDDEMDIKPDVSLIDCEETVNVQQQNIDGNHLSLGQNELGGEYEGVDDLVQENVISSAMWRPW